ncbi:MAG: penicillin-binding transpeptidase domain-containing protein, partial [Oscillospiraceae bacterium]
QGVDYQQSSERQYIDGDIAPNIIGHIGMLTAEEYNVLTEEGKTFSSKKSNYSDSKKYLLSDRIGKDGIENAMEEELRGSTGTRQIVMNNKGDVLDYSITKEPTPGNTVALTIDSNLQRKAQQALEKEIHYLNQNAPEGKGREADAGAVVAIDIKTGDVLVAANYPSYNLETFGQDFEELNKDPLKPMVNRALMGQYRPGSCFKPIVATAGLDNGIIDPTSTVNCTYQYTFYDDYQPYCLSRHGPINVYSAIKHSCNIFFYDVGRRVGIDEINKYATGYGIGQPTGVEIGEGKGRLSSPEFSASMGVKWEAGNVLQASIGQLDTEATPIQLANYAATIANKGQRMKLHLVKNIQTFDFKQTLYQSDPAIASKMDTPPEVFNVVRDAMVQTQRSGSAYSFLGDYPIDIACKTGTPETTKTGLPNSTFICFAPAEDPQIAIAVVIEKGWHGYTGAPVARAIFDEYFFGNSAPAINQPNGTVLE